LPYLLIPQLPSRLLHTGALACEHPLESFSQILQHVPAVGHLHGLRRACPRAFSVLRGAIATDNLNTCMGLQPLL